MKAVACLLLAGACATAGAQSSSIYLSGQELLRKLTGSDSNLMMAYGYIAGVHDSRSGTVMCIPPNVVTLGQMADMVKQTLEKVPSERHLQADIFVEAALSSRWPCAKKGGGI
jgi:hypothetical protein